MLKSLKKNRELKATLKAEEHLKKGAAKLDGKLYKQAMIEFQYAFKLDAKTSYHTLKKDFNHYIEILEYEAALTIGLIIINIKKDDYELVNLVGNCARRQKNYKQANNLYRYALKIKKNFAPAFFNLAASMGKVNKYDLDIKKSLDIFSKIKDYILPEYTNGSNFEENVIQDFLAQKASSKKKKILKFKEEINLKEQEQEIQEARVLSLELKQLEQADETPTENELRYYLKNSLFSNETSLSKSELQEYLICIFNFGIYALNCKFSSLALNCFNKVKKGYNADEELKYLDMLTAIAMSVEGKTKEAIDFFIKGLGKEQYNRYFNINLGFMYKSVNNRLLSTKYLAIGAELLEKSDGLFRLSDIIRIAKENVERGNLKKALKLYKIAASEVDEVPLWEDISRIYIEMKRFDEAGQALNHILHINPESAFAKTKLKELHDHFCDKGEIFLAKSKFQASVSNYEKALRIMRLSDTIKKAASVYKVMKNNIKVESLTKEYEELLRIEREGETEKQRLQHIKNGKLALRKKQYKSAIEQLELAFRLKLDKDVFVLLASIYKSLKKKEDMQDLLLRWNKKVEYEEKIKKFERDNARAEL